MPAIRIVVIAATALVVVSVTNLVYQVVRKPTEMLFPVSGAMNKMPAETWQQYAPLFREYSTATITPELLAALAQVEGAGNPVARTYWRWRLTWNPFAVFQPASSAVGMYQMTDAVLAEARRYCIRHHTVVDLFSTGTNTWPGGQLPCAAAGVETKFAATNIAANIRPAPDASPTRLISYPWRNPLFDEPGTARSVACSLSKRVLRLARSRISRSSAVSSGIRRLGKSGALPPSFNEP